MTLPRLTLLGLLACVAPALCSAPALGQSFNWNNTGSDWATPTNWTPSGPPVGNGTTALFNVTGTYGTTAINQPTWSADPAFFAELSLNPTAQFTGWTITSPGTLTHFGFRATGPVTHTFNGPSIQDSVIPAGNGLRMQIEHGSTVSLTGTSTATVRTFAVDLSGGTLRLDNSTVNNSNRLAFFNLTEQFSGINSHGGILDFIGHADGSSETIEFLKLRSGASRVNVENHSASAPTVLTITSFQRLGPTAINFANTGPVGTLGAPGNNPRIMLTSQSAGFIGSWATVNSSELAFYDTTNGVRAAVNADFSQVYTNSIGTNLNQGQFGALNQDPGTANVTWSGAAGDGDGAILRIRPGAAGQSLTFALSAGNNVNLRGLVLAGSQNYAINGNAGAAITGFGDHRTFGVLDPGATLTVNVPIAFQLQIGVLKYGDGILDLAADMTGAGQIAGETGSTPMYIHGGVLRMNVGPNGSLSKTSGQRISFRGGVLEIAAGTDGIGTDADFTRSIGTGPGHVNWSDSAGQGSGGFSAFGANASVNIGGSGAPVAWEGPGAGNSLKDGAAFKFGSIASNARLRWLNPVNLDNGTSDDYKVREIHVTRGVGGLNDYTMMTGAIGGSTTTDLMKTGTGVLEFIGQNTYQGNTLIHAGTLVVGGGGSLGTAGSRTGNVVVGSGAVLAGVGDVFPEVDRSIFVNPGGAIRGGSPVTNDLAQHTGTLTINSDVTIHSNGTDRGTIQFEFDRTAPSVGTASKIVLGPPFNLNLNPGASNQFAIDLVESGVADAPVIGETYTVTLATVDAAAQIRLNGVDLPNGVIPQSNYVLQSSTFTFDPGHSLFVETDGSGKHLRLSFAITPVPEPIMALALAAGSLGLGRVFRRRR